MVFGKHYLLKNHQKPPVGGCWYRLPILKFGQTYGESPCVKTLQPTKQNSGLTTRAAHPIADYSPQPETPQLRSTCSNETLEKSWTQRKNYLHLESPGKYFQQWVNQLLKLFSFLRVNHTKKKHTPATSFFYRCFLPALEVTYPSAPSIQLRKFFNAGCQGSVELILWERQTSELLEVAKVPSLASEVAAEPSKECQQEFLESISEKVTSYLAQSLVRGHFLCLPKRATFWKFRDSKEVDWRAACTEPQKINTIKHVAQNSGINVENLPQNKITLYNIIQVILASQGRKFQKTTKNI